MTTTRQLWLGFGTVTAILLLSGLAILFRVQALTGDAEAVSREIRGRSVATRQLEAALLHLSLELGTYLETGDAEHAAEATHHLADAEQQLGEYRRLTAPDAPLETRLI